MARKMFSHGDAAMISRNVEARIVKLETRRQRPNEILLVWRNPGQPVKEAIAGADFAPGDRVMCVEWFGEGPLPAPHWHGERFSHALSRGQYDHVLSAMARVTAGESIGDPDFVRPIMQAKRIEEMSDNDLLYCVFGAAT